MRRRLVCLQLYYTNEKNTIKNRLIFDVIERQGGRRQPQAGLRRRSDGHRKAPVRQTGFMQSCRESKGQVERVIYTYGLAIQRAKTVVNFTIIDMNKGLGVVLLFKVW